MKRLTKIFLVYLISAFIGIDGYLLSNIYGKVSREDCGDDPLEPLFLTPYIESGKIDEAQSLSEVIWPGFHGVKSYAGYLTVNTQFKSNMFFWYFPAFMAPETAPVVLWLQGGPGATSMIGLFTENGPFVPKSKHGIKMREYTWARNHHVIYIDNPVGSGYSFTSDDAGYCRNETIVGENLYTTMIQFFKLFPKLQQNEFYVTGESYAGKYVPTIAYTIHKKNQNGAELKINLQGLAIGNGLCDPEHQLLYSDYLYQLGLIDSTVKDLFKAMEAQGVQFIQKQQWKEAFEVFDNLLNGDLNNHTSLFKNNTGFDNYFNYLNARGNDVLIKRMNSYVQQSYIRNVIHVGNTNFSQEAETVEKNLMEDVMQSVAAQLVELLSNYRVLFYNGQLDIIVAYPLTVNFLKNLQFSGAEDYKTASRHIWRTDDGDIAGYVKHAGNMTEILVRNAGHMVPTDQPKWAFDMITKFTREKSFY